MTTTIKTAQNIKMVNDANSVNDVNTFKNEHSNIINEIAHSLHEAYLEQRGSIAWLFQQPQQYKFLYFKNKYINLISVVDLLHMCCLSSKKSSICRNGKFIKNQNYIDNDKINTWDEIISKLLIRNEVELAIYTLAVKKFLNHKNIILAYYTNMFSDLKTVDFNQQVLLIDIECIKKKIQETGKSLWKLIKNNSLLISKYENNNMEQLNFWNNNYTTHNHYINDYENGLSIVNNTQYPQVYYKFIDVDTYSKNNTVKQNLFIHI